MEERATVLYGKAAIRSKCLSLGLFTLFLSTTTTTASNATEHIDKQHLHHYLPMNIDKTGTADPPAAPLLKVTVAGLGTVGTAVLRGLAEVRFAIIHNSIIEQFTITCLRRASSTRILPDDLANRVRVVTVPDDHWTTPGLTAVLKAQDAVVSCLSFDGLCHGPTPAETPKPTTTKSYAHTLLSPLQHSRRVWRDLCPPTLASATPGCHRRSVCHRFVGKKKPYACTVHTWLASANRALPKTIGTLSGPLRGQALYAGTSWIGPFRVAPYA